MRAGLCLRVALAGFAFTAPTFGAMPDAPLGVAIGNAVTLDYGQQDKVIANFHADGTVDFPFPSGEQSSRRWLAGAHLVCTVKATREQREVSCRCEHKVIARKKLVQYWRRHSTAAPVTATAQPRSS